ncbi:hypothetical protein [Streptomyces sp. NPDC002328]|uniref:hypothetical protein n=1 Tax=Streptomyces sp. NPDC002328 TaxID=3364642 RepID=UPI0036A990CA
MDLLDWHRDRLSARRLAVLIEHLPRDSALNRDLHGEAAEWSVTDHLLAAAVDHLAAANWMFACVNTAEDGDQPEPPAPVPRPGGETNERDADAITSSTSAAPDADAPPGFRSAEEGDGRRAAPSAAQLARFFT